MESINLTPVLRSLTPVRIKPKIHFGIHILDTGTQILDTGYEKFTRAYGRHRLGFIQARRRTQKIFWEDWYARDISRFVGNKVRLFQVRQLWELHI